jgi:hypothetical protein
LDYLRKIKTLFYIVIASFLLDCSTKQKLYINPNEVLLVEIIKGFRGEKIEMKSGFNIPFIEDLNNAEKVGPYKFMKSHTVIVYYQDGSMDTLLTNGIIYQFKGYYKSEEDLIKKYQK